jgi:hypothetical protein
MDNQDTTFSQQLARQIRIQDIQGGWRRASSLRLDEFEQLWNETANEIRGWKNFKESNNF